jgi:hypothetical protein
MATLVKTPSGTWKAVIRKVGFPTATKTFRTKRDAEDWSRRTEDEMVRGVYIQRAPAERMTVADALKRYLAEVSPTKRLVRLKPMMLNNAETIAWLIEAALRYGGKSVSVPAEAPRLQTTSATR